MFNIKLHIVTFPVWWYTTGLLIAWEWVRKQFHLSLHRSGIVMFARHWREPLYGDYSRVGIIFSFFLRIVLLIGKAVIFAVRTVFLFFFLIVYVTILPAVVTIIFYQIFGLYA